MEGCDRTPRAPEEMPNPGQLLHSLHTKSREDQLDAAQRMLDASDSAVRCFTRDHEGRLLRDDEERALLLWLHAEAVWKAGQFQAALRQERALAEDLDDRRARWAEEHEKRRDELERSESSRQAWAEEAGQLKTFRSMVHMLLGYKPDVAADSKVLRALEKLALAWQRGHTAPWSEIEWLRREVEFEANAEVPRSDGLTLPLCSCVTAEQAAQIAAAGPLWTPPQCAVHPVSDSSQLSSTVSDGHAASVLPDGGPQ